VRALVVFESSFGNTEAVARAVAEGLALLGTVELVEACDAPARLPGDIDLVVAGGPTHAFGLSRVSTRDDAVRRGALHSVTTGLRRPATAPGMRWWASPSSRLDRKGPW
jgi:hypothetical protein